MGIVHIMVGRAVLLVWLLCLSLCVVDGASVGAHVFDGLYRLMRPGSMVHTKGGSFRQIGDPLAKADYLPYYRRGCQVDSINGLLVFSTADDESWKYVKIWTLVVDITSNSAPVMLGIFTSNKEVGGLAIDIHKANVYVALRGKDSLLIKQVLDYTDPFPKSATADRVKTFVELPSKGGEGGGMVIMGAFLYVAHASEDGSKKLVSKCSLDNCVFSEVSALPVGAGDTIVTMVNSLFPTEQLYVSIKPGGVYPGDVYKLAADGSAAPAKIVTGLIKESFNEPAFAIGKKGEGIAISYNWKKVDTTGEYSGSLKAYALPDVGEETDYGNEAPSTSNYPGPVCYTSIDECLSVAGQDPACPKTQDCEDPDPDTDGDYICKCIAPATGDPVVAGAATCSSNNDCETMPPVCTAGQTCVDDDGLVNDMFTCNDGDDDCTMSGCDAGQKCVDEDKTKDGMFKCDCPDGQTGMQGVSAPATMCVGGDDCVSGCDAGQKCVDADMTQDGMFTCDCPDGQTGMQGVNAPATMCVGTIVTGDCDGDPCGTDQDCEDTDMPGDGKYSCKCRLPQTGDVAVGMKATCTNGNDDCSEQPTRCGEFQTCEDADKTVDNVFACKCTSGTGEDGVNQPGKCTDCLMKDQCGTGQTCTDTDGSVDTVFTCDCVAPATGTAVGKPATCTKLDCEPNPCGDYSTCTDTQGTTDDKLFTCVCIADQSRHNSQAGSGSVGCPAPPTPIPDEEDGGLGLGIIIAIILVVLLLLALILYCLCCKKEEQCEVEMVEYHDPILPPPEKEEVFEVEEIPTPEPEEPEEPEVEEEEEEDEVLLDTLSDIENGPNDLFYGGKNINESEGSPRPSSQMRSPLQRGYSSLENSKDPLSSS